MIATPNIPIRNLFRILVYAWEDIDLADGAELDLDGIDNSANLLASMYTHALRQLIRHGLHRTYEERSEQLGVIRGRLNLWPTVSQHLHRVGKAHCTWTELDCNGPLNRALRTTADRALRTMDLDRAVADELMETAMSMSGVSVDDRSLSALHGFSPSPLLSHYVPAVTLARLLSELLVPDQSTGEYGLQDLVRNEETMHRIFERFAQRFLHHHYHPEGWTARARQYRWTSQPSSLSSDIQTPTLNTDITMRHAERAIVIDTKYYSSMYSSGQYGTSLRSGHLFQIYAYLRAEEEREGLPVHGVLLYARPHGETLDEWVDLRGIPVRMFGLDLDQPWEHIEADLMSLVPTPAQRSAL